MGCWQACVESSWAFSLTVREELVDSSRRQKQKRQVLVSRRRGVAPPTFLERICVEICSVGWKSAICVSCESSRYSADFRVALVYAVTVAPAATTTLCSQFHVMRARLNVLKDRMLSSSRCRLPEGQVETVPLLVRRPMLTSSCLYLRYRITTPAAIGSCPYKSPCNGCRGTRR